jgi:hypothetical protein
VQIKRAYCDILLDGSDRPYVALPEGNFIAISVPDGVSSGWFTYHPEDQFAYYEFDPYPRDKDHFRYLRYRAFMGLGYTLKFLHLISIGEAVSLTGGVFDAVEEKDLKK